MPLINIHTHQAPEEQGDLFIQNIFPSDEMLSLQPGGFYSVGLHPWFITNYQNYKNDLQELENCGLIIEAIPEIIGLKQELFLSLEKIIREECILCSNSSSFNPSLISAPLSGKNSFIGLHFFYPAALKNIVELIIPAGTQTADRPDCGFCVYI